MKRLLVTRFSALGDVAMTVPVVDSVARRYPQVEITVLSRPHLAPLFAGMPANVRFRAVDLQRQGTPAGLVRLFAQLRREGYDAVADLHDVLRTRLLRTLFCLAGTRVAHIDKGRKARRRLTRAHDKAMQPLPTAFKRYADVLARLGLKAEVSFRSIYGNGRGNPQLFATVTDVPAGIPLVGFAPFAAHPGKQLPAATSQALIRLLAAHRGWRILLFGGKGREQELLQQWAAGLDNVRTVAGRLTLDAELALMSHLDAMVAMDSANMHLASLVATPVVSVWGATHPYAGFMGWGQSAANAIQAQLPCRPCSVFGNRPCRRGDYACLAAIRAEDIAQKVERIVNKQQ